MPKNKKQKKKEEKKLTPEIQLGTQKKKKKKKSHSKTMGRTLSLRATWERIWVNWGSLLSSTRLSQVMSVIHFFGLGSTAFRSRAAPPAIHHRNIKVTRHNSQCELYCALSKISSKCLHKRYQKTRIKNTS